MIIIVFRIAWNVARFAWKHSCFKLGIIVTHSPCLSCLAPELSFVSALLLHALCLCRCHVLSEPMPFSLYCRSYLLYCLIFGHSMFLSSLLHFLISSWTYQFLFIIIVELASVQRNAFDHMGLIIPTRMFSSFVTIHLYSDLYCSLYPDIYHPF